MSDWIDASSALSMAMKKCAGTNEASEASKFLAWLVNEDRLKIDAAEIKKEVIDWDDVDAKDSDGWPIAQSKAVNEPTCRASSLRSIMQAVSQGHEGIIMASWDMGAFQFRRRIIGIDEHLGAVETLTATGVKFSLADLKRELGIKSSTAGRKLKYKWPDFIKEAKKKLWYEGGYHVEWPQAKLEDEMKNWCVCEWGEDCVPAESTARRYVNKAYQEFIKEKEEA